MIRIEFRTEYIKLKDLLKFSGEAESGGHAKRMIEDGEILLNGDRVILPGKKVKSGDIVTVGGREMQVVYEDQAYPST